MTNKAFAKSPLQTLDRAIAVPFPKLFVVCDQKDAAPVRGYVLRQQGLIVIIETSP